MRRDIKIGIVTAAGYTTADLYYSRLHGLLKAIADSPELTPQQKHNIIIMGGEANYLFEFDPSAEHLLAPVPRSEWLTPEMATWSDADITSLLDLAEKALRDCVAALDLPARLIRKDRAVGIIPKEKGIRIARETLEETVLVVQKTLEVNALREPEKKRIPFCAFNGGNDVFVDIGDKSWGVAVCQEYFQKKLAAEEQGGAGVSDGKMKEIRGENTLHVGDQFLSAGSNDFKARSVCTTAWIASPAETVELLDEVAEMLGEHAEGRRA